MTIAALGLVDDEQIQLDLAALALSELDHLDTDLSIYADLLQQIAARLHAVGASATTPSERASALAAVLNGEFRFTGDVATYDAPLNGDLIRVLDRRQGLPVSLSILYVAAARRVGWSADPLNTPGHVLVQIGGEEPVIIDPFNGGAVVGHHQLLALLGRAAAAGADTSPHRIGPLSNRNALVRLLMNQATRSETGSDPGRAMAIYQRMTLIAPDNPDGWWSLARLQLAAGMVQKARGSLTAMLEITREPQQRHQIVRVLDKIPQG